MLITDQVATAPCTDCVQVRILLLRQSRLENWIVANVQRRSRISKPAAIASTARQANSRIAILSVPTSR